jgi:hypothetical protein
MRGLSLLQRRGHPAPPCRRGASTLLQQPPRPAAHSVAARSAAPDAAASPSSPDAAATASDQQEALDLEAEYQRYERFRKAFREAQTMSQLYNVERPPPVPLAEFEERRLKRETQEVADAARRLFGAAEDDTRAALAQLDSLVPGLLDLSAMTAREFALLASDVRGAAARVVALRVAWPRADVGRVLKKRPRMLLPPDAAATLKRLGKGGRGGAAAPSSSTTKEGGEMAAASLVAWEAASVRLALAGGNDPSARAAVAAAAERGGHTSVDAAIDEVVSCAPELMDPQELSRALAFVRSSFPCSRDHPAALLAENPRLLLNLAESDVDDSAEYGEITTRF